MRKIGKARGVTLVEVVMATGIAALFLTAFMLQYRTHQSNNDIASDELRLPSLGNAAVSRLLGLEGLALAFRPRVGVTVENNMAVAPGKLILPKGELAGSPFRVVEFVEEPASPLPPGSRPGKIQVLDPPSTVATYLSAPGAIATMSFYSDDLVTGISATNLIYPPVATLPPKTVCAGNSSTAAFHILGAARTTLPYDAPRTVNVTNINHGANENEWRFGAAAAMADGKRIDADISGVVRIPFAAGGFFLLTLPGNGETLVCAWPITNAAAAVSNGQVTYQLNRLNTVRRLGFWIKLNGSPYSGLIALRDSFFLRN
ncbi:MAG: hypothetical protein FJZ01_26740 [Candidatus Sericytochromatia bacterium]|nr:hypothetical protein [Candidatus Tanganyikabacteria bacterium]